MANKTTFTITQDIEALGRKAGDDPTWARQGGPRVDAVGNAVSHFAALYGCTEGEALCYMLAVLHDRRGLGQTVTKEDRQPAGHPTDAIQADLVVEVRGGCLAALYGRKTDLAVTVVDHDTDPDDTFAFGHTAVEPLTNMDGEAWLRALIIEEKEEEETDPDDIEHCDNQACGAALEAGRIGFCDTCMEERGGAGSEYDV